MADHDGVARALQAALQRDEVFLEFALTNPESFAVIVTKAGSRVQRLPGRPVIQTHIEALLKRLHAGEDVHAPAARLEKSLLSSIPELRSRGRLLVSPDGELHQVPFELLSSDGSRRLIDSHIVSYVPSGSVLIALRNRPSAVATQRALAVSASPAGKPDVLPSAKAISRSVYDLDPSKLRPLPSADDEARSVASILGPTETTLLLGAAATEGELKRQTLHDFQVLHFAVHGIPSSKFPERAALLVHPSDTEDGVLQAREILTLRLNAALVTLSACDTSGGSVHGQEGAASLVRPFIAAGARTVVANLWAADDTFSLGLMRRVLSATGGRSRRQGP